MIRIGIVGPSEIALRRFLPALKKTDDFQFVGVAVANMEEWEGASKDVIREERKKAEQFFQKYDGEIFNSYAAIIDSLDTDAIYIPLPPALHAKWAKKALGAGKHVLLEKPATTSFEETEEIIRLAKKKNLALHENYMFAFHQQLVAINDIIKSNEIGDLRLYRISFGFPRRASNDFRYNKNLGGGALLDCGGYTLKYARMLLGESAKVIQAKSNYIDEFEVDLFGSAVMQNIDGLQAHISFGMDNQYKCELEVWGSKGVLRSDRVLTAPEAFVPECTISTGNHTEIRKLPEDDAFFKSILHFKQCINNPTTRLNTYDAIRVQAVLVNDFINRDL